MSVCGPKEKVQLTLTLHIQHHRPLLIIHILYSQSETINHEFFHLGNTQLIEVIQTGPGKFMTASGHSIKTSTAAGGTKTIIRTSATVPNTSGNVPIQPQVCVLTLMIDHSSL